MIYGIMIILALSLQSVEQSRCCLELSIYISNQRSIVWTVIKIVANERSSTTPLRGPGLTEHSTLCGELLLSSLCAHRTLRYATPQRRVLAAAWVLTSGEWRGILCSCNV